jgi:hypothetical protein
MASAEVGLSLMRAPRKRFVGEARSAIAGGPETKKRPRLSDHGRILLISEIGRTINIWEGFYLDGDA